MKVGRDASHDSQVVRRAVEQVWNQGDLALADVLFHPTYVNHGGLIPDLVRGPEAIKVAVAFYRTAFPALHITSEVVAVEQDTVELRWEARGSHFETPPGPPAIGQGDSLQGTTLTRLIDGQIAETWTSWPHHDVLRRLGIRTGG